MKNKRSTLLILLIILLTSAMLITSGCSSTKGEDTKQNNTSEHNTTQPKTLVLGEMWEINSIDTTDGDGGTLICEKAAVTETLVGANPDFSLKPGLATSWKQIDDNTWEFKLRNDVIFHDGTKMTAKEVKSSLENTIAKDSRVASMLKASSIDVVDDYTFRIKTSELNPIVPGVLHYPTTAIISPSSFDKDGKYVKPVGTGPYKF